MYTFLPGVCFLKDPLGGPTSPCQNLKENCPNISTTHFIFFLLRVSNNSYKFMSIFDLKRASLTKKSLVVWAFYLQGGTNACFVAFFLCFAFFGQQFSGFCRKIVEFKKNWAAFWPNFSLILNFCLF